MKQIKEDAAILELLKAYFPGATWSKQQNAEGSYVGRLPVLKGDIRLCLQANDSTVEGSCLLLVRDKTEGNWLASAPEWVTIAQTATFQAEGSSMESAVEAAVIDLHRQVTIIADALTGGLFGIQIQPVIAQEREAQGGQPESCVQSDENTTSSAPIRA